MSFTLFKSGAQTSLPILIYVCVPLDVDCLGVCVAEGCSSSCLLKKPCPLGYSCMSGRCFAKCDLSKQTNGVNVCGLQENYQCLLGLSSQTSGIGLCGYSAVTPPTTEKVRLLF